MKVTGWKGGTYGVRISSADVSRYFDPSWPSVVVELDGEAHTFSLSPAFWRRCAEIRGAAIGRWLLARKLAPWPHREPPVLDLLPLGGSRFRLLARQD